MNILPLVFGFLFVFSILSAKLWHSYASIHRTAHDFSGYMQAERQWRNRKEEKRFRHQVPLEKKERSQQKQLKSLSFQSWRDKPHPVSQARFHFAALIENPEQSRLRNVALSLIHQLYSHALFYQEMRDPSLGEKLVNFILEQAIAHPEATSFEDLLAEPHPLHPLLYKMVMGTNHYDIEKKIGYPPLDDFFSLKGGSKPIAFRFATRPLLIALLSEPLASEIIGLEKGKWEKTHARRSITQREVRTLLNRHYPAGKETEEILALCHFSSEKGTTDKTVAIDADTDICIKRALGSAN